MALPEAHLTHRGVIYRPLDRDAGDYAHVVDLQAEIWGPTNVTPASHLIAVGSCGAILIGAFDDTSGSCIGFCYGFPAHDRGQVWLHSHQTAVSPESRDRQVGETLKWLQRALALDAGYEHITWTFDPLQARNAHINLEKLGGTCRRYLVDYYGPMRDPLNEGLPTDRLWLDWPLRAARVRRRFAGYVARSGIEWPAALGGGATDTPSAPDPHTPSSPASAFSTVWSDVDVTLPAGEPWRDLAAVAVVVEVPADLSRVRARLGVDAASLWRLHVRRAFLAYLDRGYVVAGFRRWDDDRGRRGGHVLVDPAQLRPAAGGM